MSQIRIAFIGCGGMSSQLQRCIPMIPEFNFIAPTWKIANLWTMQWANMENLIFQKDCQKQGGVEVMHGIQAMTPLNTLEQIFTMVM